MHPTTNTAEFFLQRCRLKGFFLGLFELNPESEDLSFSSALRDRNLITSHRLVGLIFDGDKSVMGLSSTVEPIADVQSKPLGTHGYNLRSRAFIGTAGWNIPREEKPHFPGSGSHLERYAARFSAVEINSSFYRPHRTSTYTRWAASVPADFRFAVKVPKAITHTARLENTGGLIAGFLSEVGGLGEKLGCLLVQLPPSLAFKPKVARGFFEGFRAVTQAAIAFEPRHASWFETPAEKLLEEFQIARAAADPAPVPAAAAPGGWRGLTYHRLHGSPRMYYSAYPHEFLTTFAERLVREASDGPVWCIFDNTAHGFALPNARELVGEWEEVTIGRSDR